MEEGQAPIRGKQGTIFCYLPEGRLFLLQMLDFSKKRLNLFIVRKSGKQSMFDRVDEQLVHNR